MKIVLFAIVAAILLIGSVYAIGMGDVSISSMMGNGDHPGDGHHGDDDHHNGDHSGNWTDHHGGDHHQNHNSHCG